MLLLESMMFALAKCPYLPVAQRHVTLQLSYSYGGMNPFSAERNRQPTITAMPGYQHAFNSD